MLVGGEGEDNTILKASLASAEVSAGAVAKADQKSLETYLNFVLSFRGNFTATKDTPSDI